MAVSSARPLPGRAPPRVIPPFDDRTRYHIDHLAEALKIRRQSIHNSRFRGRGPHGGVLVGGTLYFTGAEINAWLEGRSRRRRR